MSDTEVSDPIMTALQQLPSILSQSLFASLPVILKKHFNKKIFVKILNEPTEKTSIYQLKEAATFDTMLTQLADQTTVDFNLDQNSIWEFIPTKQNPLNITNMPVHAPFNEETAPDIISFLNKLFPFFSQDLGSRSAEWIIAKAGNCFYLRRQRDVLPHEMSAPPSQTYEFMRSVCLEYSFIRIGHYSCQHHLCNSCYSQWSITQGQDHVDACPECRALMMPQHT